MSPKTRGKGKAVRTSNRNGASGSNYASVSPSLPAFRTLVILPLVGGSTMREKLQIAKSEKLYHVIEKDYRPLFVECQDNFFLTEIAQLGWGYLLGGDDWFLSPFLVHRFDDLAQNLRANLISLDLELENGGTRTVIVGRELISVVTGIPLNLNFDPKVTLDFNNCALYDLVDAVAPYAQPRHKEDIRQESVGGTISAYGMQVNVSIFCKWINQNVLGNQSSHKIRVKAARFAARIIKKELPVGFCMCDFLVWVLKGYSKLGSTPLSFLVTRLMAHILGLTTNPDAIPYSSETKTTHSSKSFVTDVSGLFTSKSFVTDVSGLFTGIYLEGCAAPRVEEELVDSEAAPDAENAMEVDTDGGMPRQAPPTTMLGRYMTPRSARGSRQTAGESSTTKGARRRGRPRGQYRSAGDLTTQDYCTRGVLPIVEPTERMFDLYDVVAMSNVFFSDFYDQNNRQLPVFPRYVAPFPAPNPSSTSAAPVPPSAAGTAPTATTTAPDPHVASGDDSEDDESSGCPDDEEEESDEFISEEER